MPSKDNAGRISIELAKILREEREAKRVSMTALAARAGLSQQMVSFIERGTRKPTLYTLIRISDALNADLPKLIQRAIDQSQS